ncbi:solute carrier family 26 member 6-like [Nilaparvata lugens]|uniref:solute carrier family 26 member 6-like n=1 Tax=Nilaparvata lugens TaxID=108931 RepID=UPI00193CB931|nr:solute carrier family 26 member 6-like [Nilaparvata lugens]
MDNDARVDDQSPADQLVVESGIKGFVYENRKPFKQVDFNRTYHYSKVKTRDASHVFVERCQKFSVIDFVITLFPILKWLPKYKWKTEFQLDVISGITVGILHIPQGLAYSSLGLVPPIVGIYMAFFPVLIYTMMGTSRHISMGTFSVICIMTSKPVLEYAITMDESSNSRNMLINNSFVKSDDLVGSTLSPVQVAAAVCLVVGLWQVLFGVLRFGSISVLMSEFLVSGFTTGAAFLVLTSQLKHIFGLKLPKRTGHFKTIHTYIDTISMIGDSNIYAIALAVTVVMINVTFNEFFKPIISRRCPVPVPVELLIIIGGSTLSLFLDLPNKYGVTVVGDIPTGFPEPTLPPLWLLPKLAVDGFLIALVAFSINISMASIFARRDNYDIDANQELLASGCGNLFASFFSCIPFCASLSRSSVQYSVGGKTQLASAVSCIFLTGVLLYVGPFFEPLPNSVLAGIIIVALLSMFYQVKEFWSACKQSKRDGFIWMTTFVSVIVFEIDVALIIGLTISVISLVIIGLTPSITILGRIPFTSVYLDLKRYQAETVPGILILQVAGAMNFANTEAIRVKILKLFHESIESQQNNKDVPIENVILDMSTVFYVDPSSSRNLISIHQELLDKGISLSLVSLKGDIFEILVKCDFFNIFPDCQLYPTIQDAISFLKKEDQFNIS